MSRLPYAFVLTTAALFAPASAAEEALPAGAKAEAEAVPADPPPAAKAEPTARLADREGAASPENEAEVSAAAEKKKADAFQFTKLDLFDWMRELSDEDAGVRADAATNLVRAGAPAAKELDYKFNRFGKHRRLAALDVLERIGNTRSRRTLAERAVYDKYPAVRKAAARAVAAVGGSTAQNYILARAFSDNMATRHKVARAIANIQDPAYVDHLFAPTRTYLATVAQGPCRVRGKLTTQGNPRHIVQRRWTRTGGSGNAGILEPVELPMTLPSTETTEFNTVVLVLALVLDRDVNEDNIDEVRQWWQKHRGTYAWPDIGD